MNEFKNNSFFTIKKLCSKKILVLVWKKSSEELNYSEAAYKFLVKKWTKVVQKHRPKEILIDARQHFMIIDPEIQTWFAKEILSEYEKSGVRKIAFVISQDFISQLSIEQVMKENQSFTFQANYFADDDQALDWLTAS